MTLTSRELQQINDKIEKKIEAKHKHLRKDFEEFKKDMKPRIREIEKDIDSLRRENDRTEIYFNNLNKSLGDFKDYVKLSLEKLNSIIEKRDDMCLMHGETVNNRIKDLENWKISVSTAYKVVVGLLSFLGISNVASIIFFIINMYK